KNKLNLGLIAILLIANVSCKKEDQKGDEDEKEETEEVVQPTSCIEGPTSVDAFEEVTFESCSENAASVEWNITYKDGDGNFQTRTSSSTSVKQNWNISGSYEVELTAYSEGEEKSDVKKISVRVEEICYNCFNHTTNDTQMPC